MLWPENIDAVRAYQMCADQWEISDYTGRRIGLNLKNVESVVAAMGAPKQTLLDVMVIARITKASYNKRIDERAANK
jgi:hypothetical protein